MGIYPVTYYILGAYLNEYPLKWNWKAEILALILVVLAGGVYNYARCYDRMWAYFLIVPAVYLCSALTAQVVEWCRMGLTWVLNRLIPGLQLN